MPRKPSSTTATIALIGFSLSTFVPKIARASGSSGSSSGSSSGLSSGTTSGSSSGTSSGTTSATSSGTSSGLSSGTSSGLSSGTTSGSSGVATVTTGATTIGGLIAGTIIFVVLITEESNERNDDDRPRKRRKKGTDLLEAGLLTTRQDLGMAAGLLVHSPAAMDQLNLDVARGNGPGLDALVRATGLPGSTVAKHWSDAAMAAGPVVTEDAARKLVVDFVARVAPELPLPEIQASNLLMELMQERERPDFPAKAPAHAWVARWMGVPVQAVVDATATAFAPVEGASALDTRVAISTDPGAFLDALAGAVEESHGAQVDRRIKRLTSQAQVWMTPQSAG